MKFNDIRKQLSASVEPDDDDPNGSDVPVEEQRAMQAESAAKRAELLTREIKAAADGLRHYEGDHQGTGDTQRVSAGLTKKSSPWFISSVTGEKTPFQTAKFVHELRKKSSFALTVDGNIAIYGQGVYHPDITGLMLKGWTTKLLGDLWTRALHEEIKTFLTARLAADRKLITDRLDAPILNCRNGLVNLVDGRFAKHTPDWLSVTQLDIDWDPNAVAPFYENWMDARAPGQIDVFEEAASQILDGCALPPKALFLYGPSRSGKSTALNIVRWIAGNANTSAVSLHQMADDRFAVANLMGKRLNVAADLSSNDVRDLSAFKMLTGGDVIHANRKYGNQFAFVNMAMLAFSANTVPVVSEASKAYVARIVPVKFPNSFMGSESDVVTAKLRAELPGILVRWVKAWQNRTERKHWLEPGTAVALEFATSSDRVAQFVDEILVQGDGRVTTVAVMYLAYSNWCQVNGGKPMGRNTFNDRLKNAGVAANWKTNGQSTVVRNWVAGIHQDPFL